LRQPTSTFRFPQFPTGLLTLSFRGVLRDLAKGVKTSPHFSSSPLGLCPFSIVFLPWTQTGTLPLVLPEPNCANSWRGWHPVVWPAIDGLLTLNLAPSLSERLVLFLIERLPPGRSSPQPTLVSFANGFSLSFFEVIPFFVSSPLHPLVGPFPLSHQARSLSSSSSFIVYLPPFF